jgi:hypothetical protein
MTDLQPEAIRGGTTPEDLLVQACAAQHYFWDLLGALEDALGGIEISADQDLDNVTIESLIAAADDDEEDDEPAEEFCECGRAPADCTYTLDNLVHGDRTE